MLDPAVPRLRPARQRDAPAIASLHAASWRRHYRGAYSDAYLDGEVVSDRLQVWRERLRCRDDRYRTYLSVDDGEVVGFIHLVLDEDPRWGALVDNLHVASPRKRAGIGTSLLVEGAAAVRAQPSGGMYLWVLEQNRGAQRFYEARGGRRVARSWVRPPGGDPTRLVGQPAKLRYRWTVAGVARLAP